jgi:hypothetical protein
MGEDAVRVAHAQGLLTRPSLNQVQHWALRYYLEMQRRIFIEDKEAELERELLNVNPEAWQRAYGSEYREEPEFAIQDPRDLDRWVSNLNKTKAMSGADISDAPFWSAAASE